MTQPNTPAGGDKVEAKPGTTPVANQSGVSARPTTPQDTAPATKNADKPEEGTHFARLGVNPDVSDFVKYGGYSEDENYVPDPHFQYGTMDTSDTAGAAHQNIKEISPVFAVGRAAALSLAARALDPEDTAVPANVVSLPDQVWTADQAKEDLLAKVEGLKDEPVVIGGMTPEQRVAATDADGNVAEAPKGEDAAEVKPSEENK